MSEQEEPIKKLCKLFKLLGDSVPDFCDRHFTPRVEWQKFCSNKNKCHDEFWRMVYQEKGMVNKRLDRLEEETGIKK